MAKTDMVISKTGAICAVSVRQNHSTMQFQSMQALHRRHVSKEADERKI